MNQQRIHPLPNSGFRISSSCVEVEEEEEAD